MIDLGNAATNSESKGISISERTSYCRDPSNGKEACLDAAALNEEYIDCECVLPLGDIYWILVVLYIGFFMLAVYLEKVLPNEDGVSLQPYYFLTPK